MKKFKRVKNYFENLRNHIRQKISMHIFKPTMDLAPISVLYMFGNQYIMGSLYIFNIYNI